MLLDMSAPACERAVERALLCASLADSIDPIALQMGLAHGDALSQDDATQIRLVHEALLQLRAAWGAVPVDLRRRIVPGFIARRVKFAAGCLRSDRP